MTATVLNDICPNLTDPNNTASNGPAALDETTVESYHGEENLTRPRSQAPDDYDLVILSSFGGPEGQEDVIPFLRNVTRGRGIPDERLEEVATHYRANGGISPINAQNRALLAALREAMEDRGPKVPITWANRNWEPYVNDVVSQAYEDGARKILVLATSAYPGYSSCRQYREDYGIALEKLGLEGKLQIDKVRQFWDAPGFIKSFVDGLVDGLKEVQAGVEAAENPAAGNGKIRVMFCTHSVPTSAANEAGPRGVDYEGGSAYVEKHLQAARAVLAGVEAIDPALLDKVEWELVYQSRSGPPTMPWLEPDVNDALEELKGAVDGVVLVPLGFVSDHMEVKWDLDTEALDTCAELGFIATRTPTPGIHPDYVESLRQLIAERVSSTAPSADPAEIQAQRDTVCGSRGWFDACNPDCCKSSRPGSDKPVIANYTGDDTQGGARG
ncbi:MULTISPECIES: ferrochelatase [unclassified Rothia (in: high G+C Gram-positive bacteria)]|uniref:ferrochelatase n=1 Tax=unclassified Rothia (in: high G+C Gram-positive bacteria) TaxID=2689056 RepID=UPI00195E2812|nr:MULTISPECIES: ferrochelatase [unclassified Rothia (in: high G+C Gram-positive bacteria)]MBM7051080.1 ferrochelatase [Rothia sp. ZJ1223]QRZ62219.1 ferrochelatase [Rothia sp. ZJ932]